VIDFDSDEEGIIGFSMHVIETPEGNAAVLLTLDEGGLDDAQILAEEIMEHLENISPGQIH